MIHNDVDIRPRFELSLPVRNGGEWGDDEVRPFHAEIVDGLKKCDGLNSLSKAHFVCQDAVPPVAQRFYQDQSTVTCVRPFVASTQRNVFEQKQKTNGSTKRDELTR